MNNPYQLSHSKMDDNMNNDENDESDNIILRDLDSRSDLEPSDNVFDEDNMEDEDDDPEQLAELERRKEEILEEFLEIAF